MTNPPVRELRQGREGKRMMHGNLPSAITDNVFLGFQAVFLFYVTVLLFIVVDLSLLRFLS